MSYGQNLVRGVPGHPQVGWAPNLPQGVVLGWVPIGFAVMATRRPSQNYFGHTSFCPILICPNTIPENS